MEQKSLPPPKIIPCEYEGCNKCAEVFWKTPKRKKPFCFCKYHSKVFTLPAMAKSISYEDLILEDVMES